MTDRSWSRRELLKSAGTGALALAAGAVIHERMSTYIVGTDSDAGVTAASSVSDTDPLRIDLRAHTPWQLVRGTFSSARAESLTSRDDVAFVQPDRWLETASDPSDDGGDDGDEDDDGSEDGGRTVPWGTARIGAETVIEDGRRADGVDIGIIDSGIDATHPDLKDAVAPPTDEDAHKAWVKCRGGDCEHPWSDDGGHGTHVAGTAAGASRSDGTLSVAPGATLHALKVCGGLGRCRTSAVAKAVRYAADQGWDVVNLSLGSPQESPALQAAGEYALEAGVVLVAAAGNRGRADSVGYPAAYDEYLGVSATTIDDGIAGFSSRGPGVDIAAPGADICAPVPGGYDTLDGTSMAAPHVAGAAAHAIADGASAAETRVALLETAEDLGLEETEQGAGLVDVAALLGEEHDGGTGDGVSCPAGLPD